MGVDRRTSQHEHGLQIALDLLLEIAGKFRVVDDGGAALEELVVRQVEGHVDDHPEHSVPPDHEREELRILAPAHHEQAAIGQEETERLDGLDHRGRPDVPSVRVGAERAPEREDVGGLHHLHGQAVRIDVALHVVPRRAGLRGQGLGLRVEREHLVEVLHVQDEAAVDPGLAALAVAAAGNGDLEVLLLRFLQQRAQLLEAVHLFHPAHLRGMEPRDVGTGQGIALREPSVVLHHEGGKPEEEEGEHGGHGQREGLSHGALEARAIGRFSAAAGSPPGAARPPSRGRGP